jgi:hypothetical protein
MCFGSSKGSGWQPPPSKIALPPAPQPPIEQPKTPPGDGAAASDPLGQQQLGAGSVPKPAGAY